MTICPLEVHSGLRTYLSWGAVYGNHSHLELSLFYYTFKIYLLSSKILDLYQFPISVLTSYHKVSGSKQDKFIILQFWRSEVRNEFYGVKIHMLAKPYFFVVALGENLDFCLLWLLEAPWLVASSCIFKGHHSGNSLAVHWLGLCTFTAGGLGSIPGQGNKTPTYIPKMMENRRSNKNLYIVHSGTTYNSQKLEATKMSING